MRELDARDSVSEIGAACCRVLKFLRGNSHIETRLVERESGEKEELRTWLPDEPDENAVILALGALRGRGGVRVTEQVHPFASDEYVRIWTEIHHGG